MHSPPLATRLPSSYSEGMDDASRPSVAPRGGKSQAVSGSAESSPESTVKARVQSQFGRAAQAYVVSEVHALGESLAVLLEEVRPAADWEAIDVATGAGHCALAFAPRVRSVVATDLTQEMLGTAARLASERGIGNLSTRRADAEALPFADASVDLLTCRLAFHHFPHPDRAMHEFARVLRPGGKLGFTDNVVVQDEDAAWHYNEFERLRDPSHHEALPLSQLIALIEDTGLHVLSVRRLSKEMEFADWCDRQQVSAADRERLLTMAREIPPALAPLLRPRWDDGTMYFTLWEAVVVAEKPAA
jgi:ubiquinone/menaquinone biosynthesis C-methylase UbiE